VRLGRGKEKMKCYTIEDYDGICLGIIIVNFGLVIGEDGCGRERNVVWFDPERGKYVDKYERIYIKFFRVDTNEMVDRCGKDQVEERLRWAKREYGEDNIRTEECKIPVVRLIEYKINAEKENEVLVYFKTPIKINIRFFKLLEGEKYKVIEKGICAEGMAGRVGRWEEYLIKLEDGGWLKFKLSSKKTVFYPFYKNEGGKIIYIDEREKQEVKI
jgi:hypothetical protein